MTERSSEPHERARAPADAGLDAWEKGPYAAALRRFPERKPQFETSSGIVLDPLYGPDRDGGYPGEFPYTRGVRPSMYRGQLWTIVRSWMPPQGFQPERVDIAFDVTSYPAGVIDMAYFSPAISRTSGAGIPQADVTVEIDGNSWQRWSRHRVEGVNSWNPESDSIASHYGYMLDWFKRELER